MTVSEAPLGRSSRGARWAIAAAIILAEYFLVSLRFDAATAAGRGGAWGVVSQVGQVAKFAAVVAAAVIMVLLGSTRAEQARAQAPIRLPALAVHGACFLAFWRVTALLFGSADPPSGSAFLWFALWFALGTGAVLALLTGLVGLRRLAGLFDPTAALIMAAVGVAAWLVGGWSQGLWSQASRATFRLVVAILRVFFPDATANPADRIITLEGFSVFIAPQCSGLEGVGLVGVLMAGYLVAFRKKLRFPQAWLLLPIAIATVWLFNGFRVAALLVLGARVDPTLAHAGFHAKAGWTLFCAVALAVAAIGSRSSAFSLDVASRQPLENPVASYLLPLLSFIAVSLVTGMFTNRVDYLYGLRLVAAGGILYHYRDRYRDLRIDKSLEAWAAGVLLGVAWVASAPRHPESGAIVYDAFRGGSVMSLWSWMALRVAGSTLVVPICEELAFRGFLLRWLVRREFIEVNYERIRAPLAILASSIAFGVLHERWLAGSIAGLVYALIVIRRGHLGAALVAHAATNAIIAAWVIATSDFSLWL